MKKNTVNKHLELNVNLKNINIDSKSLNDIKFSKINKE